MSVISVAEIENASGVLTVGLRDILTPLALDRAKELGIRIERAASAMPKAPVATAQKVALGAPPSTAIGQWGRSHTTRRFVRRAVSAWRSGPVIAPG